MDVDKGIIKKFVEDCTGWQVRDTSIKKMVVHSFSNRIHRQITSDICVGKDLDTELSEVNHQPVLAIFESEKFLVVTPDKTRSNKKIYFFDEQEVLGVEREA